MTNIEPSASVRNGLLFLCGDNTARSQMAEAFARFIGPAEMRYFSAGATCGADVHVHAIKAMKEVGVDISLYRPKTMDDVPMNTIATVISLCPEDQCPTVPDGVHHLNWPLPDPVEQALLDSDGLVYFRRVREQIRELVSRLF